MLPPLLRLLTFRDLDLTMQPSGLQQTLGGNLDLLPTTPVSLGLVRHDLSAIEIHGVRDLTFAGLQVHWEGKFPEFNRNAVHADGYDGLTIDGFRGEGSSAHFAAFSFLRGKNLSVRDARAESGDVIATETKAP